MTERTIKSIATCALLIIVSGLFNAASAHLTLEHPAAHAGRSYKAIFRVGHGCETSPTREIVVTMPAGVEDAKPMPKAGWSVAIEREKLAQPRNDRGKSIIEDVHRIRWTARTAADALPADFYDEFVLQARLPAQTGPIYWVVEQICTHGRIDWSQVPSGGQQVHDLETPAVALERMPATGAHSH